MSPYQHIFSANAVLNVFRSLRNTRDQSDFLLTLQYHPDDVRVAATKSSRLGKGNVEATTAEVGRRGGLVDGQGEGRSIGFVVPWRSMQAQKRELREKEKELAEALVVLAGEVAFTDLPAALQAALVQNPRVHIRHLAAGLSRQMSRIELQMADNAPFASGKNLYTGGEIVRKFLPPVQSLFQQKPVPQRMIFELLMEVKDLVYTGMAGCDSEVVEWELSNFESFEELDECLVRATTPLGVDQGQGEQGQPGAGRRLLKRKPSAAVLKPQHWLHDEAETLYHLESLETTAAAMTHLCVPITDFLAKSTITLRRTLPRHVLNEYALRKKRRTGQCAEYARCMKWSGTSWRQGGGCRRGCKNEDEDPEGLPSWHSSSRWFDERGAYMVGGGKSDGRSSGREKALGSGEM